MLPSLCCHSCVAFSSSLGTWKLGFLFKKMKVSFGVHVKIQGCMKDNAGETKNANHPTWPPLRGSNWRPYLQSAPALRCHTRRGAPRRVSNDSLVAQCSSLSRILMDVLPYSNDSLENKQASRLDTSCFSGTLGRLSLGLHQFISPTKATSCVSPHKVGKTPHFFCVRELLRKFNSNFPSIVQCFSCLQTLH